MRVTWHSFDFLSGRRGPQVITRQAGSLPRVIGEAASTDLDALVWDERAGTEVPGWDAALAPGRSLLVALDDDERIVGGGLVLKRQNAGGPWMTVALVTPEAYLDRRYLPNLTFTQQSQTQIMRDLIAVAGVGTFEVGASDTLRDRTYPAAEDKTILSAVSELSEVIGGPEFTCEIRWTDETHTAVRLVWIVRDRIGGDSAASFQQPGSITDYSASEEYDTDNGANHVIAVSSGEGDVRPESDPQADVGPGWPTFEHRFTPSTSITRKARLNRHAQAKLAQMRNGLAEITFEARLDVAPLPGVDFHLGDTVEVVITSPRFPARVDENGATVPGLTKTMRIVGYTLDLDGNRLNVVSLEE